ncbi:zinc-alpha-2-glycoprotein-like isoform X2 [Saccopteryx leptura]|uniref:zinc-alpha-2-glycoprotein-like isoform X1 n=1 Tax=Saccopteryx leptura TaxID=249018 RepID=UPI00339BC569
MSTMVPVLLSPLLVLGPAFSHKTQNDPPSVSITSQMGPEGHSMYLKCTITGFYPEPTSMYWTRESNVVENELENDSLLTENGNYQHWVMVEVPFSERHTYSCHVEHGSLAQPLVVPWNEGQESGDQ